MNDSVVCFLPCRKGSQRVPKKNIRPFSNREYGLLSIKIEQILSAEHIKSLVLSTNDEEIISYAQSVGDDRIVIHRRAELLSGSQTSTDELVPHVADLIKDEHILWTHVTSPFVTSKVYDEMIVSYFEALPLGFDSLMSVNKLKGFVWDDDGPVNYDRSVEKWPRTQTLAPLNEINSAAFIASSDIYIECGDRIGQKTYLYETPGFTGFDIDWEEDFLIAECLLEKKLVSL
ncbi:acylneuraminate cytidylyltransferase family protein [Alcanivorax sediminis]|uniref:Acylneuraminate cytidylyltransferase family protein n=1 Tax=Alcanivorax sediminis TaxID=2663008 RepID=A0A6N7LZ21_9GAMM|nr:acylneuraminate cytidylyltransferase family protein [Alcanivorax sediminis]MQX54355.1 acylneuraminate cytidylyltransferase family protein [Alcanivorax sediminis]